MIQIMFIAVAIVIAIGGLGGLSLALFGKTPNTTIVGIETLVWTPRIAVIVSIAVILLGLIYKF